MVKSNPNEPLSLSLVDSDSGDFGQGDQYLEGKSSRFYFSEESLSTHFLFLGSPGTGKTNAIIQFVDIIKNKMMNENDVMIIFDTKGDYFSQFFDKNRGDILISNFENSEIWNIFEEIKIDRKDKWDQDAYEVSLEIFDESIRRSKDPYFPMAAMDVTRATIIALLRSSEKDGNLITNKDLYRILANSSSEEIKKIISAHPDQIGASIHINNPNSNQTQGVMGQIKQDLEKIFNGRFGQSGNFSIRKFIRERGGKTLFLEYDLTYGKLLTPIYRLIIDLAIKEALGREQAQQGNVYFIIDEFALLPNLYHIEDAINFGRGLGIKLIVGTQNVNQIYSSYGTETAKSILASFGTVFTFRLNDEDSKNIVSARYGRYISLISKISPIPSEPLFRTTVESNVIEHALISKLNVGEAIVCISGKMPRLFQFKKANTKRELFNEKMM